MGPHPTGNLPSLTSRFLTARGDVRLHLVITETQLKQAKAKGERRLLRRHWAFP